MKKITITCFCFYIIMAQAIAQLGTTSLQEKYKPDPTALFKKAKNQKAAAWILIATGTVLFVTGETIIAGEQAKETANDVGAALTALFTLGYGSYDPAPVKHSTIAPVMVYSGLGAMLVSIPLFISAHKNKKQASIIIRDQTISLVPAVTRKQLAVGVKINL